MSGPINNSSTPILLLKTKSSPHDGYEEYFSNPENGQYQSSFVPVLEHHFQEESLQRIKTWLDRSSLQDQQRRDSTETFPYGGIIFTSQRAVEAFSKVIGDIRSSDQALIEELNGDFPLYVVGPATARGLRALELPCPVIGEECGNGEVLATFILQDYNKRMSTRRHDKLPLLFLVGEQRRDIIPKTLQSDKLASAERIKVDEVVIYETGEMQSFRENFSAIYSTNASRGFAEQWVVVFSPTGCKAMLEILKLLDPVTGKAIGNTPELSGTHIATIGPTTRDYLVREFGFEPDVCAQKPSPQGVGDAIRVYTQQRARTQDLEHHFATQIT